MSRRTVYECDFGSCERFADGQAEKLPDDWAEISITLNRSGAMSEGWRPAGSSNTRVLCVCPEHARVLMGGALALGSGDR